MSIIGDCPSCKKGILRPYLGFSYSTIPPKYSFTCEKCGYNEVKPLGD